MRKSSLICKTDTDKSKAAFFSATHTKVRRCLGMSSEFHIFFCEGESSVQVQQTGFGDIRRFPSLGDATRHLRNCLNGRGGLVVIHNGNEERVNRIPLYSGTLAT